MSSTPAIAPQLAQIQSAASALQAYVIRSPLLPLQVEKLRDRVFLKLENLQPIGAFKARPVGNILLNANAGKLAKGVYTASTGNAGVAMAWMAGKLGFPATIYVPESAPEEKLEATRRLGARIKSISDAEWWDVISNARHPTDPGLYVDAVRDTLAIAGNATIGVEILQQMPDVETIVVPYGGGGLSSGIAAAIRAIKPDVRVIVAETEASTPLTTARKMGKPTQVQSQPSFVTGAGAPSVLEEMWPLVSTLIDDTAVLDADAVATAMRLLFTAQKVVVEPAGAISVAAALADDGAFGKTVCVISGGNVSATLMAEILKQDQD